jgi:alpha-amylase/alpha-mannosidase (GH57 family)
VVRLALLWHLHQPDYRDPNTGRPVMPWVRLHALRGYRDLCLDILESEVGSTVNVVPSLLDQLLAYAEGQDDRHIELTARPAAELTADELEEVRQRFVCGHSAMIEAHPAYAALAGLVRTEGRLDTSDVRDLQIWSTLAWFGATALRDYPELGELQKKAAQFSEDDKAVLLRVQQSILKEIPEIFRRLAVSGTAAVSTSPYFHPILPLLVDTRHARRCMPHLPEEGRFSWPEDAALQLRRARQRLHELFGVVPQGLWPSEGSVSPEVVEIAAAEGFRWIASDEGVLHRSALSSSRGIGGWDLGQGVVGFFRDRELSDRIGFDYARRNPQEAVNELLNEVERRGRDGLVVLALDGENPWEAFADAGAAFRQCLHQGLRSTRLHGVTLDAAVALPRVGSVQRIHTGSWIQADFGIWIGHPLDRRAWRLLADARRAIDEAPSELRETALNHLLPAQGSDWMWWYGDEFSTPFADVFDALFRTHLRAAWEALGRTPPAELERPLTDWAEASIRIPRSFLSPSLVSPPSWAAWAGAGRATWPRGGSMARGAAHTRAIDFGWSEPSASVPASFWVCVEVAEDTPYEPEGSVWRIRVGEAEAVVACGGGASVCGSARAWPRAVVARFDDPDVSASSVEVWVTRGSTLVARYPEAGPLLLPHGLARSAGAWV